MNHEAFYTTAEQVIPVLFLVIVFETRTWGFVRAPGLLGHVQQAVVNVSFYVSLTAELVALFALWSLDDDPVFRGFIFLGLFLLMVGVGVAGLERLTAIEQRSEGLGTERAQDDEEAK